MRFTRVSLLKGNPPDYRKAILDGLYLAILALLFPSMAEAASVIRPIVACKDEADSKKVLEFLGKNDKAGLDKFSAPKLTKGDCLTLSKGMSVTIDTKDAKLFCVRPAGGLDCYWTADAGINQNPAEPEAHQGTHSGGGGRRHGGGGMGAGGGMMGGGGTLQ
ncbi:MAG TPA: hypothetical protein VMU78_07340 [Methylocella sp.]|nr:hypothetical protein [Methylocella sp.]